MFLHRRFPQRWFYTQIPSRTSVFAQGYFDTKTFYTQAREYFYIQMPSRRDAAPEECLYTLLHRASFDTKQPLHAEAFTVNTLPRRFFFSNRNTVHLYEKAFLHTVTFTNKYFCTDTFTERCFYTQVLWTRTHLGKRLEARFGGGIKPFWNQVSIQYVLTERCFYIIQVLLHGEGPSDRDGFTQRDDLQRDASSKLFSEGPLRNIASKTWCLDAGRWQERRPGSPCQRAKLPRT